MSTCPTCDTDVAPENAEEHKKMHQSGENKSRSGSGKDTTVTCPTCGAQVPESKKQAHKQMHADE